MAYIYGSASSTGWKLRIKYEVTQDYSGNKSTVALTLSIYAGTSESYNLDSNSCYYTLQGTKVYNPYSYKNIGWYTLGTKTITVEHSNDGTGGVKLYADWHSGFTSSYTPASLSVSQTITLPKIPRASSVSASGLVLGTAGTLSVKKASSAYTHTIKLKCGSASEVTVCTKSSSNSVSFTPPIKWAEQNTAGTIVSIKATITTYNGSSVVGTSTSTLKAEIPSSVKPKITSYTEEDSAGYATGTSATYGWVQNKSKLKVDITGAEGAYGSTIVNKALYIDGKPGVLGADNPLPTAGTVTYALSVTDSRGRTATLQTDIIVHAYSPPRIKNLSFARGVQSENDWEDDDGGKDLKVVFVLSLSLDKNKASVSLSLDGKTKKTLENQVSGEISAYLCDIGTDTTQILRVKAKDGIGSTYAAEITVPTVAVLLNMDLANMAACFGGIAEKAKTVQFKMPVEFLPGFYMPKTAPSLTDTQKNQLISLVDDYRGIRERFSYDYDAIRDIYAKSSDAVDGTLYRINCGLFLQLLWMGRSTSDYPPLVDDNSVSPPLVAGEYDNAITKAFDWGFYFPFARHAAYGLKTSSGGYFGWKKPNEDSYKGSYSWNSHYSAAGDAADNYQIWDTFAYAADMAEELYRMGCEVPMAEIEVGDVLFFRSASLSDGDSDLYETRAFRHISHAAMLYGWSSEDLPIFVEATALTPPIIRTSLSYSSDYDKARAANLMGRVCMVARHPAAYGKGGNVPKKITRM